MLPPELEQYSKPVKASWQEDFHRNEREKAMFDRTRPETLISYDPKTNVLKVTARGELLFPCEVQISKQHGIRVYDDNGQLLYSEESVDAAKSRNQPFCSQTLARDVSRYFGAE